MASTTEGPWRVLHALSEDHGMMRVNVCTPYRYGEEGEEDEGERWVADCGEVTEENLANARLISAAPYMRWVLKQHLAILDGSSPRPTAALLADLEAVTRKALKWAEVGQEVGVA